MKTMMRPKKSSKSAFAAVGDLQLSDGFDDSEIHQDSKKENQRETKMRSHLEKPEEIPDTNRGL